MAVRSLRVGLTYDLRDDYLGLGLGEEELAEFDRRDTIDALEGALRSLGHHPDRIGNLAALVARLHQADRWDLVFNIAEGRFGLGREAQVPALLDAYEIPYTFSDPLASSLTLHKATAKRVLRDHGLPTPAFLLVESFDDLHRFELDFPVFAKPVAEGTSKGIDANSRAHSLIELETLCRRLLDRHQQAVLVEEYLPGRELTVGVLGTGAQARSAGALEVVLLDEGDQGIYTFRSKEECEVLVRYEMATDRIARASEELAVAAWRALGCRDGGRVDLRCDRSGRPQVMEVNPLPGMHPDHSDLPILWQKSGRRYEDLVGTIVTSAAQRLRPAGRASCAS